MLGWGALSQISLYYYSIFIPSIELMYSRSGLAVMIAGAVLVVIDTLKRRHTHLHTHTITHTHDGTTHTHTFTHEHAHSHYLTEEEHRHKHTLEHSHDTAVI